MNRRGFLRATGLAALGGVMGVAHGSLLPVNAAFGRTFTDLQDARVPLSTYLGRPVLMNFWASWCAPCVREMPLLESLHQRHPDLALLGLAVDTKPNVLRFLEKVHVSYPLLLTGTQGIALMRELGNKGGGLPFTVLFDRQGRPAGSVVGELKPDLIETQLQQIL